MSPWLYKSIMHYLDTGETFGTGIYFDLKKKRKTQGTETAY